MANNVDRQHSKNGGATLFSNIKIFNFCGSVLVHAGVMYSMYFK